MKICQHQGDSLIVWFVLLAHAFLVLPVLAVLMASASSSVVNQPRSPPVSFVVSDHELADDGMSVVSSCVLRQCFGFYEVSRERLLVCDQSVGLLLHVVAPNLRSIVDNFATFTREQYAEIARAHFIYVSPSDRKDHV
jgi:hypothetical protein